MYKYLTEQWLPVSRQEAWRFFSTPNNLARITPPELGFKILNKSVENDIQKGMLIDYTVSPIMNIPLHWRTEISNVDPENSFTDRQLKGPYKVWEHTHTFIEQNGGILMRDEILYELPMRFIGNFVHWLFVKNKIIAIFNYRREVLNSIFTAK